MPVVQPTLPNSSWRRGCGSICGLTVRRKLTQQAQITPSMIMIGRCARSTRAAASVKAVSSLRKRAADTAQPCQDHIQSAGQERSDQSPGTPAVQRSAKEQEHNQGGQGRGGGVHAKRGQSAELKQDGLEEQCDEDGGDRGPAEQQSRETTQRQVGGNARDRYVDQCSNEQGSGDHADARDCLGFDGAQTPGQAGDCQDGPANEHGRAQDSLGNMHAARVSVPRGVTQVSRNANNCN